MHHEPRNRLTSVDAPEHFPPLVIGQADTEGLHRGPVLTVYECPRPVFHLPVTVALAPLAAPPPPPRLSSLVSRLLLQRLHVTRTYLS